MSVLLDTQAFLWWVSDDGRLSRRARTTIAAEHGYLSSASCWEMAIKASLGELALDAPIERFVSEQLAANGLRMLEIELEDVARVAALPFHHRDPFDRLLVAQALRRDLRVVSADRAFTAYGVKRVW